MPEIDVLCEPQFCEMCTAEGLRAKKGTEPMVTFWAGYFMQYGEVEEEMSDLDFNICLGKARKPSMEDYHYKCSDGGSYRQGACMRVVRRGMQSKMRGEYHV